MIRHRKALSQTRVRTATVLQYEAVECGAASLKIILQYFGRIVPLAELRERCGISRDGVTAIQLKRTAITYGCDVRAYRCSAQSLSEKGLFPCIIFWNFSHFLVLEGFQKDRVFLSDPASGRRQVSREEFNGSFTGVVLELKPNHEFQRGGKEINPYAWIPGLLLPYKSLIGWLLILSVVGSLPDLFVAGTTAQFIDAYLQEGRLNFGIPILWITGLAVAALIAFLNLQKVLLRRLGQNLVRRISSLMFVSLFSLPYRYFLQRMRGEIATRLILPFTLVQLSVSGVVDFILALGSGLIALVIAMLISPWLTLMTLAVTGGNTALTMWLREFRKDANYKLAMVQGKANGTRMYAIQGIESLKASGLENEAFMQWAATFADALEEIQNQSLGNSVIGLIGTTSGFLLRCAVIMVGGLLIIQGQLTLGELMAFQFLQGLLQAPLQQLGLLTSQLQMLDGQVGRVNDVIQEQTDPRVRSFLVPPPETDSPPPSEGKLSGRIELQEVSFQFSSTTPVLFNGLNLTLQPGQQLAIVGGSGSGKSTLLRLLAGLYTPTGGDILYDGRSWLDWNDAKLRHSIAYVSQDVFLFPATVMENLSLWDPRFSAPQALDVLEKTALLDALGGSSALQKPLTENGSNLSGGQRQRIEIARALLRSPSILLLDEATSALDEKTERHVLAAIKTTPCTLVTVAHRMYSAQISDWVLVMDQGQIVQMGTPEELSCTPGRYRELLEAEQSNLKTLEVIGG